MKHELIDVAEPNLIREQFPYDAVPRIIFDGEFEQPDPAPDFFITDTTFRDGQQARPPYTAGQIVAMFDMLHRLGGPQRHHPADRVLPVLESRSRGGESMPRARLRVSRGHRMDSRGESGLQDRQGDGPARDRDSHVGVRLPYFQQAQENAARGDGRLPRDRQRGARCGPENPLPSRGRDARGFLRLRRAVRVEVDGTRRRRAAFPSRFACATRSDSACPTPASRFRAACRN